jgi:hypothetical protein
MYVYTTKVHFNGWLVNLNFTLGTRGCLQGFVIKTVAKMK